MSLEQDFFYTLSFRLRKENDLSDITWALCSSSDFFRKEFLRYCFDEEISDVENFYREVSVGDSRPDFCFSDGRDKEYLIEVKIYDTNDHFVQYEKTFPRAVKSFIANYEAAERDGWKIKTWKNFSKLLESKKPYFPENEKEFISAYIAYLNSVINILEAKQMNLSNMSSLRYFFDNIQKTIDECAVVRLTTYSSKINEDIYGKYVYYSNKNGETVYFWFGLYITEPTNIYFMIDHFEDENWCPRREVEIIENLQKGEYFDKIQKEGNRLRIPMKSTCFEKFRSDTSVDEQMNILKEFLAEILNILQ
jgi:hypothetical protein